MSELENFLNSFYDENPFYPKWPWGRLSKRHMRLIDEDNTWFKRERGLIKETKPVYEPAPF
jgi:hypothetical protein